MIRIRNKKKISHIRVLGARNSDVLSALAKASTVPLVTGSAAASPVPDLDIVASDIFALTQSVSPYSAAVRDYTEKLILGDML